MIANVARASNQFELTRRCDFLALANVMAKHIPVGLASSMSNFNCTSKREIQKPLRFHVSEILHKVWHAKAIHIRVHREKTRFTLATATLLEKVREE
jgi:hypothetical protein